MPVVNPFAVIAGTLSAGTTNATLGGVSFSNANGVSFGINGQTITASVAAGGGGNTGSISAGTTRLTLGEAVFSNSNGMSFGVDGQTITGSYTVPSTAGLLSNINVSGGTTSNNLSNIVFSNVNNVSFGLNGSTITASVNSSLTNINISAGTTSNNLSALTFSNLNGLSFGLNGSVITGSYTVPSVPAQTNQTLGLYAVGNTTGQSSSSTFDARTLSFVGQGIASVGFSNGSVNVSVVQTVQTQGFSNTLGMSNLGNTSGTSGVISGTGLQFLFAGGANITLSQSIDGQSVTLTISGGAGGAGNTGSISAGTTRATLGEVVFSNSNGVSFGVNGQTVTGSIATSLTAVNVSAGTTSNNLSAMVFSNSNGISFGLNASTITASVATSLTAIRISAGTTSNLLSAFTLSNSNNVSFGLNASTVTASAHINVSGGTTSNNLSAITFSNSNGISFGLNASTMTASVATSLTAINVSAGTTSNNLSAMVFSNSNNFSFGLNGSTITGSYTVPGTLSVFAQSNTTQSSSGTIPFNSLQFQGAGIASVGVSNGSVVISVPSGGGAGMNMGISTFGNTSGTTGLVSNQYVFVGSNGITLSQSVNGQSATLTISGAGAGGGITLSGYDGFANNEFLAIAGGQASLWIDRLDLPCALQFDRFGIRMTHSNATNSSGSATISAWVGVYTRNVSSLSLLASTSFSTAITQSGTVGSYSNYGGVKILPVPWTTTLSGSNYWLGIITRTTTGGANMTFGNLANSQIASTMSGYFGSGSNATNAIRIGVGVYSATTSALPAAISLTQINGNSSAFLRQPAYLFMSQII